MRINLYEAKTRLSELVDAAGRGKIVTIGKAGKPVARLVPLEPPRQAIKLGLMKGKIRIASDFDAPLPNDLARAFGVGRRR